MARPRKLKFPISLEEWLRAVLRKKRPEDRMKTFREWRRSVLRQEFKREPTDQEVEDQIKLIRERGFNDPYLADRWAWALGDFVPDFHKENRRIKARNAALKRWSEKK